MTAEELTAEITKKEQLLLAAESALTGSLSDEIAESTFHTGTYGAYQRYKKTSPKELMSIITVLESQLRRLKNLAANGSGVITFRPRRYG